LQTSLQNDPPLTREQFEAHLKKAYADASKDPGFRAMAFAYNSDFSPSERDDNWKARVEEFLFGSKGVKVKIFDTSNSHPINDHRPRKFHRP